MEATSESKEACELKWLELLADAFLDDSIYVKKALLKEGTKDTMTGIRVVRDKDVDLEYLLR